MESNTKRTIQEESLIGRGNGWFFKGTLKLAPRNHNWVNEKGRCRVNLVNAIAFDILGYTNQLEMFQARTVTAIQICRLCESVGRFIWRMAHAAAALRLSLFIWTTWVHLRRRLIRVQGVAQAGMSHGFATAGDSGRRRHSHPNEWHTVKNHKNFLKRLHFSPFGILYWNSLVPNIRLSSGLSYCVGSEYNVRSCST